LLLGDLSEGKFVERLADFSLGLKETGVWKNEEEKNNMGEWANNRKWDIWHIWDTIFDWNLSSEVPDFEKFVRNYWYANYGLGVCNASLQNSIKKSREGRYYVCEDDAWEEATEYDVDIYETKLLGRCSKEGEIKEGQISNKKYICKNNAWAIANYIDIKCSEKSCSAFTDTRDNQRYYSVVIGGQTWMAQNLNYNAAGSQCYNNNPAYCDKYGRLYDWATAMDLASTCNSNYCASQVQAKHRGICPSGWHIPSNAEWDRLYRYADGSNGTESPYQSETAGKYLKATSGWSGNYYSVNSTDAFGFSALPGGLSDSYNSFRSADSYGYWYSASESNEENAFSRGMDYDVDVAFSYDRIKSRLISVRCVKDN